MKAVLKVYVCFFTLLAVYGQAPQISYTTPNTFSVNEPIVPLVPSNTGGGVSNQPVVSTFAGSGVMGSADALGIAAGFNYPTVVTTDNFGNLIVVDRSNHKIRKISADGAVTTLSGTGAIGTLDGPALSATFRYPDGAVVDSQGNILISDQSNHKIRKLDTNGIVSTFAGSGVAGFTDGTGATAKFYYPAGMAIDANDNLYVADYSNHRIRKVTPGGLVTTYAGLAIAGATDGNTSVAKFNGPTGVAVDASGNVFVADYNNHKIRKISTLGEVSTVAGTGIAGAADGASVTATFNHPAIVAVDTNNNLFITDEGNHKIRKISSLNEVTTFAGTGTSGANDAAASSATFNSPTGVCVDNAGTVYIADYGNHKIRKISRYGYGISPDLPAGLTLNSVTGEISGTPAQVSAMTDYTVTATNEFGSNSFVISIEVGTLGAESFGFNALRIYPNPVSDTLYVTGVTEISSITVFNPLGQQVKEFGSDAVSHPIDFRSFSKGIYRLKIATAFGTKEIRISKQ
ncbi:hypothetical protein FSS13T_26640 [Flavobacterium saliperosum S13]|uniref:Por secretion system C-terminal sorting domain-containing protein n=2 Tax=Flavobacterium saliperosum TaxID=329186 RepID=A0A1G4W4U4_9FLAO|nr:putative Ig domain-containing protein [Flavobacterium saliperosum]ESU21507.1 hypothetical protein FSS13T_26640 [Flavobacterium saliperosum S13]SCX16778.1 Por secretion system C-terminal sorting domain-containing protein [Flavobacterium saliperosum]